MLNSIKDFLFSLEPDIIIQAPARINLINPLDAVEADFWMPSLAVNGKINPLSAFFYIKSVNYESRLKIYKLKMQLKECYFEIIRNEKLVKTRDKIKKKFKGPDKLIYASIYRFFKMSSYFEEMFLKTNIEIGVISTIPLQSGLGGSAAVIIAVLYGFANYFNIFNNLKYVKINEFPINKDIIAEMATKVEDEDLRITSGYGDRYVISRGGLSFCSYYGKLLHKKISEEPLAIYDRIDEVYKINDIPMIVCYSGILHESGDIHGKLRRIYLKNNPNIMESYKELAKISWKSRFAIMCQNWKLLGEYFKENTKIMNHVMKEAGFKYGIGLANNILIEIIEEHPDVYAAKLTGAGGGGSVFALVNPNKIDTTLNYWKEKLNEIIINKSKFSLKFPSYPKEITNQLKKALFFRIKIDKNGVKKL
ncbi:MAG: mevalonate kinase [Candidatus Hodarchaeota archaeon]